MFEPMMIINLMHIINRIANVYRSTHRKEKFKRKRRQFRMALEWKQSENPVKYMFAVHCSLCLIVQPSQQQTKA